MLDHADGSQRNNDFCLLVITVSASQGVPTRMMNCGNHTKGPDKKWEPMTESGQEMHRCSYCRTVVLLVHMPEMERTGADKMQQGSWRGPGQGVAPGNAYLEYILYLPTEYLVSRSTCSGSVIGVVDTVGTGSTQLPQSSHIMLESVRPCIFLESLKRG